MGARRPARGAGERAALAAGARWVGAAAAAAGSAAAAGAAGLAAAGRAAGIGILRLRAAHHDGAGRDASDRGRHEFSELTAPHLAVIVRAHVFSPLQYLHNNKG